VKLGLALSWHQHRWEDLLALVQRADALGYPAIFVDGDISMLDSASDRDVLDGWTATTALIAHSRRIQVGSIRLVHHWNAARLAQAVATVERQSPGRLHFLIASGDRPHDGRFGLPRLPVGERIRWLDEALTALRGLWRGESVTLDGRYVKLQRARVRPTPARGALPIAVAAGRSRMLEVVAAHADRWEVNLPAIPARVQRAAAALAAACERRGRDPDAIARSQWIFTRVDDAHDAAAALADYRRWNPWFDAIPDSEIGPALVVGGADHCRGRLAELAEQLKLDLPVADLSGLDAAAAERAIEALAPGKSGVDATIWTS